MNTSCLVTLLTDFGDADSYVGAMKGVMLSIVRHLTLVDITHQVPPQNVRVGSFQLGQAFPYFPVGTVHLVVVDPGVGGDRQAVAVQTDRGFCVAPNNGVLSSVFRLQTVERAVVLDNPQYWRSPQVSSTFHGRDIFAPAAAHLANGVPIEQLGTELAFEELVQVHPAPYRKTTTGIEGVIQASDRFGNLITNIPAIELAAEQRWQVSASSVQFPGHQTYSDVAQGQPLSLIGSHGWVELAVHCGNAQQRFSLDMDDPITLTYI